MKVPRTVALAVVGLALGASCVPDATLDPCWACEGTCTAERCDPVVVARDLGEPVGALTVTDEATWVCVEGATVRWLRIDERGETEVVGAFAQGTCGGVVADPRSRSVYWSLGATDEVAGAVYRSPIEGGAAAPVVVDEAPRGLAVSDAQVLLASDRTDSLCTVGLDGGEPATIAPTVALDRPPRDVALVPGGGVVYTVPASEEVILLDPVDGATTVLVDGRSSRPLRSELHGVAASAEAIYVSLEDKILEAPIATPWRLRLAATGTAGGAELAVDARTLYVGWQDAGELVAIDLDSGSSEVVASDLGRFVFALGAEHVVIGASGRGEIVRVPKPTAARP